MRQTLDIAPLRSFVAVADCGGFQRAASSLHLSQAAVSQHVRRLESATGQVLIERQGRGSRLTRDGEYLLTQARRILSLHDETLHRFGLETEETVVIGSTEHGAAQLLPFLAAVLEQSLPHYRVRFRIDRGTKLREGLEAGRVDLALLLDLADDPRAWPVGELELIWYSAPTWRRPAQAQPIPVVAFDQPCALRTRALETLAFHAIPAVISAEAIQLAGVQAAVGAGLGVALMATLGQTPEGLVARDDLPRPAPLPLAVWSRHGLPAKVSQRVAAALRRLLAQPAAELAVAPTIAHLELAKGA
ncbi:MULTISPECIES: LysR family transcriptional regulator [Protofrankia]|uniref:LysR family transcriptional regulator n=1 Tax=Protofrankia coriariae TaxID=1562887 RepID=A0ABR5F6X9_9ACTN|nr:MULTISPECIES: LysR family transcriptional regulator [Protofrankia]KLL12482.1 LysR family transcriptional regulator [Protofrankia coriariae]ONH35525.1 LysR family transcriptional regulator [Protofrankia sp. BMG5.30]